MITVPLWLYFGMLAVMIYSGITNACCAYLLRKMRKTGKCLYCDPPPETFQ